MGEHELNPLVFYFYIRRSAAFPELQIVGDWVERVPGDRPFQEKDCVGIVENISHSDAYYLRMYYEHLRQDLEKILITSMA
jgi:hypothetical protein